MTIRKIFISGPMRGHTGFNCAEFNKAAVNIGDTTCYSAVIYNPIEVHLDDYSLDLRIMNGDEDLSIFMDVPDFVRSSIEWLMNEATGIYMLQGWEESEGASMEHSIAKLIGLDIYYD